MSGFFKRYRSVNKTLCVAMALGIGAALGAAGDAYAETLRTRAPMAYLLEPDSGTILFAKDADKPFQPGSLAKVMTAGVVFKALSEGEVEDTTACTVSEHAWRTGGAPSRGATMFAAIKSEVPVLDLLKGLIVHNANDAAIILAECLDGSEAAFAGRMNDVGLEIGMTGSRFKNPTGFEDPEARTTTRDMVTLGAYIVANHRGYYDLYSLPDFTWNKIFQRNKNPMHGEIRSLDGLGGGSSKTDGFAALASVNRDGRRVVASVAGLSNDKSRITALKEVIEGAWEYFGLAQLYAKGETVAEARVFGGTQSHVPLVAANEVRVLLPRGTTLDYRLRVVYSGPLKAPVKAGMPVGELRVLGEDGIIYHAPLETGAPVAEGDVTKRALDSLYELLFGWF